MISYPKCIDCGKILSRKDAIRCRLCFNKTKTGIKRPKHSRLMKELWSNKEYKNKLPRDGKHNSMFGKKHTEETKKKMSLIAGGNGIPGDCGDYGSDWTNKLKDKIRKRDSYKCCLCGLTNKEHLKIYSLSLSVHHIDYNKRNNIFVNLISLCNQCHARTNFNRQYWTEKLNECIFSHTQY